MSAATPPTSAPGDSAPGPLPSVPGTLLWSDSDSPAAAQPAGDELAGQVPKATHPLPTIGHIGRYALKYRLGEGGLGTVFAAHDPLLSRLIAVKTLNVEVPEAERESFNTLFINEARAAGGLSHPHIVTVFDAGISDRRAYIAMEMLKGRDLRQLRQEGWRATPAQAALIVRRVADALAFAHSKGVIHRDVKPANIFMVGRTQPRVLDFGIARVAHAHHDDGDPHSGAGSPYYMAPEQVRREAADRRADVFSLGVVLYELLTDGRPFRGETLKEIREAVLSFEPPLASAVDANVPRTLAEICARAMAKDPEHRFRSARSFARELRQWLDANPAPADGEATPALTLSKPRRAASVRPVRRAMTWAAAALAAVALGAAGSWWWLGAGAAPVDEAAARPAPVFAGVVMPVPVPEPKPAQSAAAALVPEAPASATAVSMAVSTAVSMATPMDAASPVIAPAATPVAASALDPSASATAARTAALSTPEALMSASLGLINAPLAAPARAVQVPAVAPTTLATVATAATAAPVPAPARDAARDRRRARELREREGRERELRAANANLPAAPPTGTVKIAVSPWGTVEVDGGAAGAAPPLNELTLAEGRHQIVVRNGEFAPYTSSVNVTAGQTVILRFKFGS